MASYHLSVKVGTKGKALPHASYIARVGEYETREGEKLEAVEHGNMPDWAEEDPNIFWQCADRYERKNGSTYREIEIALPRELTPEQRQELVKEFVEQELGSKHAYLWAIHNPKASIEGGEQPHAHIMYSERTLDGIARAPDQFFKRYNPKSPEKGGCQKSNTSKTFEERKNELVALRERFAMLQNRHLERLGHQDRVDHRSNDERGLERAPERHLGWKQAQNQQIKAQIIEYRQSAQVPSVSIDFSPKPIEHKATDLPAKPKVSEAELSRHFNNNSEAVKSAKRVVEMYDDLREEYRVKIVESIIKKERDALKLEAREVKQRYAELEKSKPIFFGVEAWEKQLKSISDEYSVIANKHDNPKKIYNFSHTEGWSEANKQVQENHPDKVELVSQAHKFLDAKKRYDKQITERSKEQNIEKEDERDQGSER
jgi:hypothetical protein